MAVSRYIQLFISALIRWIFLNPCNKTFTSSACLRIPYDLSYENAIMNVSFLWCWPIPRSAGEKSCIKQMCLHINFRPHLLFIVLLSFIVGVENPTCFRDSFMKSVVLTLFMNKFCNGEGKQHWSDYCNIHLYFQRCLCLSLIPFYVVAYHTFALYDTVLCLSPNL